MDKTPPDMKVRLSADLRRKVEGAAKLNNRTLNSEIVFRLESSFQSPPVISETDRLGAIESRLSEIEIALGLVEPAFTESPSKALLTTARSKGGQ
ncbi:Arc family DNA-binding protein [Sphingopyxis sp. 2PD]|uniref:Arc family DNA-binding protein n=1 Tax=Sphingopyxis sp. 2PD TaxID=2502196 RepID=UPI0010F6811B|nr:Arc family DNA-binding protein [Sphingopyxis sp. 2PD]